MTKSVHAAILAAATAESPLEACGYLGGSGGESPEISLFLALRNQDQAADHFSFDPKDQFAAVRSIRAAGLQAVGIWHSHPVTPARPSAEDIRLAFDAKQIYVIASLLPDGGRDRADNPGRRSEQVRAWHIENGSATELAIELVEQATFAPVLPNPGADEANSSPLPAGGGSGEGASVAVPAYDIAALKKVGTIQQRDKEYFVLRLRLVGGDFSADHLEAVTRIAREYGRGEVHLSTRQGIEIPWVLHTRAEEARAALEAAGLKMGACGPRARVVVACPGSTICRWGIIDTKDMARKLDAEFFGAETPHKFKLAVTGCPHNCAKASENDIGIMGGIRPRWDAASCTDCKLCLNVCPTKAISREDGRYILDESKCLWCAICTTNCPAGSWQRENQGWQVLVGGTMGKIPRFATPVSGILTDEESVYRHVRSALAWYRTNGRKRERFGHSLDRYGLAQATKEIQDGADNQ